MSTDWSPTATRRTVLRASVAAVSAATVGGLAGCSGQSGGGAEADRESSWAVDERLDSVPSDADMVSYAHVADLLDDQAVTALLDAHFETRARSEYYDGPTSLSAARQQFDDQSPVPLDGLEEMVMFGGGILGLLGQRRMANVLWTDWEESAFVEALGKLGADVAVSEETHSGKTIYRPASRDEDQYAMPSAAGVLGDGQYVMGTEGAVEDTLDVAAGDADPLAGAARDAFSASRAGPYQFAFDVPQEQFGRQSGDTSADSTGTGGFGPAMMAQINRIYGSVYVDGETRGLGVTFDAVDRETADGVATAIEKGIDAVMESRESADPMREILSAMSVSASGSTASLTYENSVANIEALAEDLGSYQPPTPTPRERESEAPALRVTEAVGTDISENAVGALELTVERAGAATSLDLSEMLVVLLPEDAEDEYELTHADSGKAGNHFETPDGKTLDGVGASARLRIDLGEDTADYPEPVGEDLPAGSSTGLILLPESERPTRGRLQVPDSLAGEEVELGVEQEQFN